MDAMFMCFVVRNAFHVTRNQKRERKGFEKKQRPKERESNAKCYVTVKADEKMDKLKLFHVNGGREFAFLYY